MGAMVFTIEAEFNGMFVNLPWALEHAEVLKAQLKEATQELNGYVPEGLPFEFKWSSRFHKSALIFGGTVNYKARAPILDAEGKQTYSQKKKRTYSYAALRVQLTATACRWTSGTRYAWKTQRTCRQ